MQIFFLKKIPGYPFPSPESDTKGGGKCICNFRKSHLHTRAMDSSKQTHKVSNVVAFSLPYVI